MKDPTPCSHGLSSALFNPAGASQGCKATICMPKAAPGIKVAAVERLGGEVQLVGDSYSETESFAQVQSFG